MTTYTPNIKLALYDLTDVPALDDQYNESMRILDGKVKEAMDSASGWEAAVLQESQLRTNADIELQKDIDDLREYSDKNVQSATSIANNAKLLAQNAQAAADNAQTTADNAQTAADNAQTAADNAQTAADNAQTAADNLQEQFSQEFYKPGDVQIIPVNYILNGFITSGSSECYFEDIVLPKKCNNISSVTIDNNPKAVWRNTASGSYINDSSSGKNIKTMFTPRISLSKQTNSIRISGSSNGQFTGAQNNGGCMLWLRENLQITFK